MIKAAATSLLLSVLFIVVYGNCNVVTSMRHDVGTLCFAWERSIPFVPWMIVPYLSMDLFFVAGPFLCRTEQELLTLTRRITFGILVAGACFLVYPLQLDFQPTPVSGPLGVVFNWFLGMDKPYNLLPSLHITLCTIVGVTYARHLRGMWRDLSNVWFGLIAASTLLTHQHQVVDVVGGFILAGYAFYLFPEDAVRWPVLPNPRVGVYYGTAALVPCLLGSWGWLLLWPALSCGIVSAAYLGLGPGIYRKAAGQWPLGTRLALGPVLWGQHLSLLHYRTQCRPWDEVVPGVWIGRKLTDAEAGDAVQQGVSAVLDLTGEFEEAAPFLKVAYRNLPIMDLTSPTQDQLRDMADFITEHRGTVYVHCKVGYSRSAAAVGAYLLASRQAASADAAIAILKQARPSIIIRPEIVAALQQFSR